MRKRRRSPFASAAPALALSAVALASLAACGGDTARQFGFTRDAPDEFQVTTRAPLSAPPALGELPVPRPGAPRPQEMTQRQAAEAALVPETALGRGGPASGGNPTTGESALLSQAGRPVSGDIRGQVDQESLKLERTDRGLVDRLMFWRDPDPPGVAVDARAESQRLRENAALGREATEGETPIVQPQRSSNPVVRLFESIF
jgi:hypothetical protein